MLEVSDLTRSEFVQRINEHFTLFQTAESFFTCIEAYSHDADEQKEVLIDIVRYAQQTAERKPVLFNRPDTCVADFFVQFDQEEHVSVERLSAEELRHIVIELIDAKEMVAWIEKEDFDAAGREALLREICHVPDRMQQERLLDTYFMEYRSVVHAVLFLAELEAQETQDTALIDELKGFLLKEYPDLLLLNKSHFSISPEQFFGLREERDTADKLLEHLVERGVTQEDQKQWQQYLEGLTYDELHNQAGDIVKWVEHVQHELMDHEETLHGGIEMYDSVISAIAEGIRQEVLYAQGAEEEQIDLHLLDKQIAAWPEGLRAPISIKLSKQIDNLYSANMLEGDFVRKDNAFTGKDANVPEQDTSFAFTSIVKTVNTLSEEKKQELLSIRASVLVEAAKGRCQSFNREFVHDTIEKNVATYDRNDLIAAAVALLEAGLASKEDVVIQKMIECIEHDETQRWRNFEYLTLFSEEQKQERLIWLAQEDAWRFMKQWHNIPWRSTAEQEHLLVALHESGKEPFASFEHPTMIVRIVNDQWFHMPRYTTNRHPKKEELMSREWNQYRDDIVQLERQLADLSDEEQEVFFTSRHMMKSIAIVGSRRSEEVHACLSETGYASEIASYANYFEETFKRHADLGLTKEQKQSIRKQFLEIVGYEKDHALYDPMVVSDTEKQVIHALLELPEGADPEEWMMEKAVIQDVIQQWLTKAFGLPNGTVRDWLQIGTKAYFQPSRFKKHIYAVREMERRKQELTPEERGETDEERGETDEERGETDEAKGETKERTMAQVLSDEFGIHAFGRYPIDLLVQQYKDRNNLKKPYAVLIQSRADHNGTMFSVNEYKTFQDWQQHTLRIIETDSVSNIGRQLLSFEKRGYKKGSLLVVSAHGESEKIHFGYPEDADPLSVVTKKHIIEGKGIQKVKQRFFTKEAEVVLLSCSTGRAEGIGQEVSEQWSAVLHAPEEETAVRNFVIEEHGKNLVVKNVDYHNYKTEKDVKRVLYRPRTKEDDATTESSEAWSLSTDAHETQRKHLL